MSQFTQTLSAIKSINNTEELKYFKKRLITSYLKVTQDVDLVDWIALINIRVKVLLKKEQYHVEVEQLH